VDNGWPGGTTTIATALAYLVGYSSVSAFASALGVSAADVGLDLRDYLLLTGLTALSWVPVLVATELWSWVAHPFGEVRRVQRVAAYVGLFLATAGTYVAGFVTSGGNFYVAGLLPGVLYVGIFLVLQLSPPESVRRWMRVAAVAMIAIATPISTLVGSTSWADSLLTDASESEPPDEGPFPIRLVLEPEIGSATVEVDGNPETACVLRVSERVFLGTEAVVVGDVTSFTRTEDTECNKLDPVPWG
jgi:hypothetical protein